MWKANGNTARLLLLLYCRFPKTEIYARCFLWRKNNPDVNYYAIRCSGTGEGDSRENVKQEALQQDGLKNEHHR
jgi:hypothetical protein